MTSPSDDPPAFATDEVSLPLLVDRLRARWIVLAGAILAGALAGLAFSALRPAVYRSTAAIAFNIDYGATNVLPLIVEDRALDKVWQILVADSTIEPVQTLLRQQGWEAEALEDLAVFRQHLRVDQRLSRWELSVFDQDPGFATAAANAWATTALEVVREAQGHAWRALSLQASPILVQCFSSHPDGNTRRALWDCLAAGPGLAPEGVAEMEAELAASRGILPTLSFELVETAAFPASPVLWDRGALVFAGSAASLLAAILIVMAAPPWTRGN